MLLVTLKKYCIIKMYLNSTSVQSSSHKEYDFKNTAAGRGILCHFLEFQKNMVPTLEYPNKEVLGAAM